MEPVNKTKEMIQAMMSVNSQSRTIKVELFSGKREDFPKWTLKKKQKFLMVDMGRVLDKMFLGKLPRSKNMELDDSLARQKAWVKYRQ